MAIVAAMQGMPERENRLFRFFEADRDPMTTGSRKNAVDAEKRPRL
jgi:hypothetical protein